MQGQKIKIYMYDAETYCLLDDYRTIKDAAFDNNIKPKTMYKGVSKYPEGYKAGNAIYTSNSYGERILSADVERYRLDRKEHIRSRLSDHEKAYIKEHIEDTISSIALELGRQPRTVATYIKRGITNDKDEIIYV